MSMGKRQADNTVWRFFFCKYMGALLVYVTLETAQLFATKRSLKQPEGA